MVNGRPRSVRLVVDEVRPTLEIVGDRQELIA
jgi:hypothetical protein